MSEPKVIGEYLTNNVMKTYYGLDEAMFTAHREDRNDFAESTARILLNNSDLPLIIRARACMVLGCSVQPDFLDMAKEAVRIAELGYSRCENPGEVEKQLVEDCKTVLRQAQTAADEYASDADDEIVWHAGKDDVNVEAVQAEGDTPMLDDAHPPLITRDDSGYGVFEGTDGPGEAKMKKVRRLHPANPDDENALEELDESTGQWVPRGPIGEDEEVELGWAPVHE